MQIILFKLFVGCLWIAHPFHVSVCDVEYNTENRSLEITHKIFLDDLEMTLNEAYGLQLDLLSNPDLKVLDSVMHKYVSGNFRIYVNGKILNINHLGSEIEEDVLRYYMEAEELPAPEELFIMNSILLETYDDQQNLVHCRIGDDVQSLLISKDEPSGKVSFAD